MALTLFLNQPFVSVGLPTYTYTVPSAAIYNVQLWLTEVPPSGLSVVINKNGAPIFTAPALSPTQIAQQFKFTINAAAADVITVVLASGSSVDNQLNSVKTACSIGQGA
jgi:hypothetical protein